MIVYLVTNTANGSRYVGVTVRSLQRRWSEHTTRGRQKPKTKLGRAIQKYGPQSFAVEVLAELDNYDDLLAVEKIFVSVLGTFSARHYNMTPGGEATPTLVAEIAARSGATRSRTHRGARHHNFGVKRSEAAIAKMKATAAANRDDPERRRRKAEATRKSWADPAVRERRIQKLTGVPKPPRSEEHKRNISLGRRKALEARGWLQS